MAAPVFEPGTAQSQDAAIVIVDQAALRAAPRDSAQQQAQLRQGELLEVRGERLDYLQVWDHQRERGGFIRASSLRRLTMTAADAPDLLAVVRFVRDMPGAEAMGIAFAAAYLKAAPAETLKGSEGAEALDALGTMADRLADRVSSGSELPKTAQATLAAHVDVASHYGVVFRSEEQGGRMQVCYDGDAFRRVLAMNPSPGQQARAVLGLTRGECIPSPPQPAKRLAADEWRADVLEHVDAATLPKYMGNRVHMRRAQVWAALAYERARTGGAATVAAQRALAELMSVSKTDLTDADQSTYNDTAMRVSASRWAVEPVPKIAGQPSIVIQPGAPGETCVLLVDMKNDESHPLARRCTYALVFPQSATLNRERNTLALAVQPLEAWRELWVFRKRGNAWAIDVLPPANVDPRLGYVDFAGWVPGGRQMLVAREARGSNGRWSHSFEIVSLDSMTSTRQSSDAAQLGSFRRWQDPQWKRATVALR
ncbi:MAG TPA: hypothetical protein VL593_06630 [Ramlibacter sp.]|nr:hypothetical protein [Ramlibacter sp.]